MRKPGDITKDTLIIAKTKAMVLELILEYKDFIKIYEEELQLTHDSYVKGKLTSSGRFLRELMSILDALGE